MCILMIARSSVSQEMSGGCTVLQDGQFSALKNNFFSCSTVGWLDRLESRQKIKTAERNANFRKILVCCFLF